MWRREVAGPAQPDATSAGSQRVAVAVLGSRSPYAIGIKDVPVDDDGLGRFLGRVVEETLAGVEFLRSVDDLLRDGLIGVLCLLMLGNMAPLLKYGGWSAL
jgi:hypothetical protein